MADDEVMLRISASAPRRVFAVATLVALGAVLIYLTLTDAQAHPAMRALLIVLGVAVLFGADRMRRSTGEVLELTNEVLRSTTGEVLTEIDNIASLDRGVFGLKPSNGFTIRLHARRSYRWFPGLWWRMGRRIGVGGVIEGRQTRVMAETITAILAQRGPRP